MNKIILTGTQGTGKTTTLNLLFENKKIKKKYVKITEVFRSLAKDYNMPLNKKSTTTTQTIGFNKYLEKFLLTPKFISDRGLIDVMAYTLYLFNKKRIDHLTYNYQIELFKHYHQQELFDEVFYFPIQFPIEKDGVRDEDEIYRKEIDSIIRSLLINYKIPHIIVKDTFEKSRDLILKKIL